MPRDIIESLRIEALRERLEPTLDGNLRKVQRWFSRTFATPLETVESYPIEYVLLHYFEEELETYKDPELLALAEQLLVEPELRALKEMEAALDDDEFLKHTELIANGLLKDPIKGDSTQPLDSIGLLNPAESSELIIEHVDHLDWE